MAKGTEEGMVPKRLWGEREEGRERERKRRESEDRVGRREERERGREKEERERNTETKERVSPKREAWGGLVLGAPSQLHNSPNFCQSQG